METTNKEIANKAKKKFSMKRLFKRVGFGVLIFFGVLIGAAVAIPYFFKDQIIAKVQEEINKNVNATVSFDDVGLSLFRSFPNFSLRLEGLEVIGKDDFDGLRLAGIENFDVTLDLMSVIKTERPIEIKNISLDQPNLYVKVLKNGKANYDIAIPSTDTTAVEEAAAPEGESADFLIQLESYSIKNGNITYDDGTMPILAKIENLNHNGKGDFTSLVYDLKTKTTADAISVNFDGVKYLNKVKTGIDLDINIDMEHMKFIIGKNKMTMNALALNLEGFIAMPGNDINMDLKLGSPSTNFKDLLSMIPAAFTADFDGVKANGQMTLNGMVKGTLNETSIPSFNFNTSVKNADFRYPDLPLGINNINTTIKINSPSSDLDKMTVDVPNFHIEIDKSPFDAKFVLKNPMSDPYVETVAKGTIILDDLAKAFPLTEQGIEQLSGTIKANLDTKTRMSYVTEEKYDQVEMKGDLAIANMNYVGEGMPKVTINDLKVEFTPQNVIMDNFDAKLGSSDLQMSGTLDNILTYFSGTKTMKGVLTVRSNKFDANEWLGGETTETAVNEPTVQIEDTTTVAGTTEVFDKFDFTLDAEFKDITYDIYHIRNTVGKGHFKPNHMEFKQMSTQMGKSDFYIQGDLENVFGYLFDGGTLGGSALFRSKFIDANELMAMTSPSTNDAKGQNGDAPNAASTMPIKTTDEELFGKFDVNADIQVDKLIYDTYKITGVKGLGNFKHDVFQVADFGMQIGNSDLKATGIINNAIDWLFYSEQKVDGVFDLSSKFFDLNQFMVAAPAPATETSEQLPPAQPAPTADVEPFLVPADMNFVLNADFGKVLYDKMTLKNARGALTIQDEAVNMTDIVADVFGGSMKINGGYDTQDEKKPKFDFALNVNDFFLNKAFDQLNTVQAIAPIAKYVEGKFNTTFTINGLLGKDMMPDFKTLNSNGLLETINAVVKNYKPLNDLATKLSVDELKALAIKNTKNTFEVKDGFVNVRPFDVKMKDVTMNIGGKHGIMQDMDYNIKMAIPRAMLEKNKATALVNTGINLLGSQASKLGLNLKQGETINILVNLLGSISKPNVKIKLLGMDGTSVSDGVKGKVGDELNKIKEDAKAKADSLKQVAEARLKSEEERIKGLAQAKVDSLKREAEIKAKAELDKIKNAAKDKANEEIKKVTDKVSDEVKDKAKDEINKVTDKVGDDVKKKAQDELNKLKNKFKNPFGKKKKGDQ